MQKVTVFFIASLLLLLNTSFNLVPTVKEEVKWLSVKELQLVYKKDPRPILVDVYTSWCGWCKVMDRETYTNKKVVAYLNEKYYAVKFDAESKDSVEWAGKMYHYKPEYKSNELALYLLYGQMSFPTTIFLPELDARPAPMAGYLKPNELEPPLKYFGDGAYKTKSYPDFMKTFSGSW